MLRLVRDVKEKKKEAAKDPMRMFRCLRVVEGETAPPLLRVDRLPPEIRQLTRDMLRCHVGIMEQYVPVLLFVHPFLSHLAAHTRDRVI